MSDDAAPEERLRGQVSALLHRVADKGNKEFLFVQKEMTNPTGLLEEVIEKELHPLHERAKAVIRELLGPHVPETLAEFCEISIISQCLNPMVAESGRGEKREPKKGRPEIDDMEAYTDHVMEFSLGGIRAVRKAAENRLKNGPRPAKRK